VVSEGERRVQIQRFAALGDAAIVLMRVGQNQPMFASITSDNGSSA
jgi:hypothetical protein